MNLPWNFRPGFNTRGSRLSRNNLATPNATVAFLQFMDRHPNGAAFRDAKTGTLHWASSLSGYVKTAADDNDCGARQEIDRVALMLAHLSENQNSLPDGGQSRYEEMLLVRAHLS